MKLALAIVGIILGILVLNALMTPGYERRRAEKKAEVCQYLSVYDCKILYYRKGLAFLSR